MTWVCGECSTKWAEAVPTCLTCLNEDVRNLQYERDYHEARVAVLEAALRPFAFDPDGDVTVYPTREHILAACAALDTAPVGASEGVA